MNEQERYQLGYDLMAEIGSILYSRLGCFRPNISNISDEAYLHMEETAEALIPFPCWDDRLPEDRIVNLRESISDNHDDSIMLYVILCQLCRQWQISPEMLEYIPPSFKALNLNWESTGILVSPKMRSAFDIPDPRRRKLDHFHFTPLDQLKDFLPAHHILPSSCILPDQKTLRIAYSPIGNYDALEISPTTYIDQDGLPREYFDVAFKSGEIEKLQLEFRRSVQAACHSGADIFFGPEMLTPASCVALERNPLTGEMVNRWLLETLLECTEKQPWLYVLSNWEKQKNRAFVFNRQGQLIAAQNKHYAYVDERKHRQEHLFPSDKQIHVLHVSPIGRICIMICADFLNPWYRKTVAEYFDPAVILVPSCSKGMHDFVTASVAELYHGTQTVYGNTCASLHFFDNPRTAYVDPVGCVACAPSREIAVEKMLAPHTLCGSCQSKPNPCIFSVDIPLLSRNAENAGKPIVHAYGEIELR